MTRVLILRPEPGASATLERARAHGLEAVAVPLFEIEPLPWEAPDPASFDGLLLTSANAVRHAGNQLQQLRGLEVYAVGRATADAGREAGFGIAAVGDSGVKRLLSSIENDLRLLHLCGEDRKQTPGARQEIAAIPVYRAKPCNAAGIPTSGPAIALVHSPRAAERFAELATDRNETKIVAISEAAAKAAGAGWAGVAVAVMPDDEAMLALAAQLCNKPAL